MAMALAVVSIASTVMGGIMSAQQQRMQAQAQVNQLSYQAAVARNNQTIAEMKANSDIQQGAIDAHNSELQTKGLIGRQRAAQAANGVVVDQGSALHTITDSAALGALDAATIRSNAEKQAWADRIQGNNFASEAALKTNAAKTTAAQAPYAEAGTLLTTGGQVASKWYNYGSDLNWPGFKPAKGT